MAPLRLLRAVAVALAVSRAAGQDYVSQALANSFSVDGDASVRAVRIMLNGDNSVLTVAWDDDPAAVADEFCGARQLEDAANREVVGHIAAALQSDGATRRALLDWADRVDDAIAPERPGAPLFELVVAQGYGPLAVVGGDTARGAADAWCAEFAIAESECYFVAATVRAARARSGAWPSGRRRTRRRRGRPSRAATPCWPSGPRTAATTARSGGARRAADGTLELLYDDGRLPRGALPIEVRRVADDDAAAAPRPAGGGAPRPRAPERAPRRRRPVPSRKRPDGRGPRSRFSSPSSSRPRRAALPRRRAAGAAQTRDARGARDAAAAAPSAASAAARQLDDGTPPARAAPRAGLGRRQARPAPVGDAGAEPRARDAEPARRSAEKKVRRSLSTAPKSRRRGRRARARPRGARRRDAGQPGPQGRLAQDVGHEPRRRRRGRPGDGARARELAPASMFAAPVSGSDGGAVVLEAEDADSDSWSDVDGDGDALQAAETEPQGQDHPRGRGARAAARGRAEARLGAPAKAGAKARRRRRGAGARARPPTQRVQQDHRDLVAEVVRDGVDGGGGGLVEAADDEDDVAPVPEASAGTTRRARLRGWRASERRRRRAARRRCTARALLARRGALAASGAA
ncbi:hypothetical protein SO694_000432103 [Aureococcus anophagefferens]|uniref:Uncharacterized protein n=1 Tax=Aureococcus anophagefferens TaxID=44056 RepID=A0ABR1G6Q1_AURAN